MEFDDLRSLTNEKKGNNQQQMSFDDFDDDDDAFEIGREIESNNLGDGRVLGMTAGERAFLSVIVFLNVVVLGVGLLLATGRLVF